MKLNHAARPLLFAFFFSSCAHLPNTIPSIDPDTASAGQALLLLQTHFESDQKTIQVCNLQIKTLATGENFFIQINTGDQSLYLPVLAGRYESGAFECPGSAWDNQKPLIRNAVAAPGKISYAGKIKFKISDGHLALGSEQRQEILSSLHSAIQKLPASKRGSLVSAYTAKPITLEMSEPRTPPGFNLRIKKNPGEQVETGLLYSAILACEASASAEDPTLIGHFSFMGFYQTGALKKFEIIENKNAFSPAYGKCVESAFRKFTPSNQSPFAAQISF